MTILGSRNVNKKTSSPEKPLGKRGAEKPRAVLMPEVKGIPRIDTYVLSHSVVSNSLRPHGLQPSRLLCPWDSPGKDTDVGCHTLLQRIFPTQGSNPGSPSLQPDSLPSESPGKPKNTTVGSLSLLQGNFPTQESNWGLLHCRCILYQLSYQGSPRINMDKM